MNKAILIIPKNMEKETDLYYLQQEFYGIPMKSELVPYKKVVNNGYTILTQKDNLLKDLYLNERLHNGIIDWHLFRVGKTILISHNKTVYGCTYVSHSNFTVQLDEFQEIRFENETSNVEHLGK